MHHTKFVCDGMNEPRFSCSKCGSRFKTLAHLQRYLIAVHKIDQSQLGTFGAGKLLPINNIICINEHIFLGLLPITGPRLQPECMPFKCGKCRSSFKHERDLKQHTSKLCGVEPKFHCTVCGYRFKNKSNLKRHLVDVHAIKDPSELAKLLKPAVK